MNSQPFRHRGPHTTAVREIGFIHGRQSSALTLAQAHRARSDSHALELLCHESSGLPSSLAKPHTGLISIRKFDSGTDQNFFNGRQSFGITDISAHFDIIDGVAMKTSR
jgi:hypothetical protein